MEHKSHILGRIIVTPILIGAMFAAFGLISSGDDMNQVTDYYDSQGNYHLVDSKTGQEQVMNKGVIHE